MGRVRTKTVKRAARAVIEKYYGKMNLDFHTNKRVIDEVAVIQSKRLRNKIAGFATHLMQRMQTSSVRGISLKLQEEERERRLDVMPDQSEVNIDKIEIDKATQKMLKHIGLGNLHGVTLRKEDQ